MSNIENESSFDKILFYGKKTFGGLFLLIMSILKTLSSNYMPLLILFCTILAVLVFLSKRILTLPCTGCSNGSWWYKCKKKTGYGSTTCKKYIFLTNTLLDVYNFFVNSPEKFYRVTLELINHKIEIFKRWIKFTDDMSAALLNLLPQAIIFKYLLRLVIPPLTKVFKKLNNFVKEFSCGFTLPVIDIKINVCELASTALSGLINLIQIIFKTIINIFKLIFTTIFKAMLMPAVKKITQAIKEATNILTKSITEVYMNFNKVLSAVKTPINILLDVKFMQYIVIVVDYIIQNFLNKLTFMAYLGAAGPTIAMFLTMFTVCFFICVPAIGAFLACFTLIKALVYLILMCDDDDDFLFLLLNIFNYIFGTKYGSESN